MQLYDFCIPLLSNLQKARDWLHNIVVKSRPRRTKKRLECYQTLPHMWIRGWGRDYVVTCRVLESGHAYIRWSHPLYFWQHTRSIMQIHFHHWCTLIVICHMPRLRRWLSILGKLALYTPWLLLVTCFILSNSLLQDWGIWNYIPISQWKFLCGVKYGNRAAKLHAVEPSVWTSIFMSP